MTRRGGHGSAALSLAPAAADPLTAVFEANVDNVFGFLLARCGSRLVAEEVAAETFAEAARAYKNGRGHEVERGWLLHVARLRLVDYWRRDDRQRKRIERLSSLSVREQFVPDAEEGDPHVLAALDSLSNRQRAVLLLRYVDDYSVSDVADALEERTTLDIGGARVAFDALPNYDLLRQSPDSVMFVAGNVSIRGHERMWLLRPWEAFNGMEPTEFFASAGLDFEPTTAHGDAPAFQGSVPAHFDCSVGRPCVTIAVLADGSPVSLSIGEYYQVAIHEASDGPSVLVISEIGSPSLGPALENLEILE